MYREKESSFSKKNDHMQSIFKQLLLHLYEYQLFVVYRFVYYLDVVRIHDAMDETKFEKK
jgi:hypothetical protein